jgi:hypothetical protein
MNFTALVATEHDGAIDTALQQLTDADLMPGDVTVAVEYSSVNYKDAVALHGPYAVIGRFPMIPGIDFAGVVTMSADTRFPIGTRVVANSWGLGQTHYGGYAQFSRVAGDWLIALPASISTRAAMALGTAGYTAMLSLMSIEHAGITPSDGPVIVTGASGGVGRSRSCCWRPGDSRYLHRPARLPRQTISKDWAQTSCWTAVNFQNRASLAKMSDGRRRSTVSVATHSSMLLRRCSMVATPHAAG